MCMCVCPCATPDDIFHTKIPLQHLKKEENNVELLILSHYRFHRKCRSTSKNAAAMLPSVRDDMSAKWILR